MASNKIGSYLGRKIIWLNSLESLHGADLNTALAFLWVSQESHDLKKIEETLTALVRAKVLGVTVSGYSTDLTFDLLLPAAYDVPAPYHLMTGILRNETLSSAIEDFLIASLPDPQCFDLWDTYALCILASSGDMSSLFEEAKGILRNMKCLS